MCGGTPHMCSLTVASHLQWIQSVSEQQDSVTRVWRSCAFDEIIAIQQSMSSCILSILQSKSCSCWLGMHNPLVASTTAPSCHIHNALGTLRPVFGETDFATCMQSESHASICGAQEKQMKIVNEMQLVMTGAPNHIL